MDLGAQASILRPGKPRNYAVTVPTARGRQMKSPSTAASALLALILAAAGAWAQHDSAKTTAWRAGQFHVDTAGVVGRSAIVLGRANREAREAMPLGNGSLGVAVWSEQGLTAQLNRADTLPDRLSGGQVVIPGLSL